jgi:hypothetical protein
LYATVGQALHTENARGLLARCRPAFAIIDRPRFDVAWALARLASERGTMMHTQTTRTGRSRNLGSRRGQGQAGQAENGGSPRPRTHPRPALGHSEASARRRRSLVRPPRAAQPRRQGPRDDGGARPDAPQEKGKAYGKISAKPAGVDRPITSFGVGERRARRSGPENRRNRREWEVSTASPKSGG